MHTSLFIKALFKTTKILKQPKSPLIDKWIKDRNEDLFTEYMGHSHGGDTTGDGNHRHQLKHNLQDKLKVDDKVILLRIGDKFVILSKVVSI